MPTFPEVNRILNCLLDGVRDVFGSQFIGMYLDGSLTSSDFDEDSDIDFVVVTTEDVVGERFLALQTMHDQLAKMDSPLADQLEGSYISLQAVRRYDPTRALHPNLERGKGERLKMAVHDEVWAVHRSILRERGIVLAGPPLSTLIDPVSSAELRQAMRIVLHRWGENLLTNPAQIQSQGYQAYIVLTMCRILYTLESGMVASKPTAARWAQDKLGQPWSELIERAWVGRHAPSAPPDPADLEMTLDLIWFTILLSGQSLDFSRAE